MKRVRHFVSPHELAYYQEHFREAIREDAVVCLECGCLLRELNLHLRLKHELLTDEYRERWGYNRNTALNIPAVSELRRQQALERNLASLPPRGSINKAIEATRRHSPPRRKEFRQDHRARLMARLATGWRPYSRVRGESLRAMVQEGLSAREIASRTGLTHGHIRTRLRALGLVKPRRPPLPEDELLALLQQGLWPSQIAAKTGWSAVTIKKRVHNLRQRRVDVPSLRGPRPMPHRRVTDEQVIALVRAGLRQEDIACEAGISPGTLRGRLKRLKRRGLLPPTSGRRLKALRQRGLLPPARVSRVPDESILALAHQKLAVWKISRQLGVSPNTIKHRLRLLRMRGLLPPLAPLWRAPDEQIIALAQQGLGRYHIARRLGLGTSTVSDRLRKLRERGLLQPYAPASRISDEQLIAIARHGLTARSIARRLAINPNTTASRLCELRQRGLLPPAQRPRATSPPTTPSPPHQA